MSKGTSVKGNAVVKGTNKTAKASKAVVTPVVEEVKAEVVVVEVKQLGRKVDPTSERQKRLAEMEAKRAAGELRKGRPVVEGSVRQVRLAELEAKRQAGELRRGRPVVEGSVRQVRMAELEAKREAGELKKGRPVNPNSAKQLKLAAIAEKKANGTFKLGRPAAEKVEAPVVASVGTDEEVEIAAIEGQDA